MARIHDMNRIDPDHTVADLYIARMGEVMRAQDCSASHAINVVAAEITLTHKQHALVESFWFEA